MFSLVFKLLPLPITSDNKIPRDSTYVTYKEVKVPFGLYVVMCVLAGCGIVAAFLFLAFNVVYRTNK